MANEFEDILNEYAVAIIERAQSNLRIKRRVRGKTVNRVFQVDGKRHSRLKA